MDKQNKGPSIGPLYSIMTLILSDHQCGRFARAAREKGIRRGMIVLGRGTVKSATLNLLGIKSQKKVIVHILLEREREKEVLEHFARELQLSEPGHGIAYTMSVETAEQIMNGAPGTRDGAQGLEAENMYKKLTVIVNRGMAEDVMDIARKSGVRGGTIMHGRGTGSEFTEKFLGMEIEPEKELVMILMPTELVEKVVSALYQAFELDKPGNGILFVEPVSEVRGLFDASRGGKNK